MRAWFFIAGASITSAIAGGAPALAQGEEQRAAVTQTDRPIRRATSRQMKRRASALECEFCQAEPPVPSRGLRLRMPSASSAFTSEESPRPSVPRGAPTPPEVPVSYGMCFTVLDDNFCDVGTRTRFAVPWEGVVASRQISVTDRAWGGVVAGGGALFGGLGALALAPTFRLSPRERVEWGTTAAVEGAVFLSVGLWHLLWPEAER